MLRRFATLFFLIELFFVFRFDAQTFINADLDGPLVTTSSIQPFNWTNVPFTDPVCLALEAIRATPDLTDLTGPEMSYGLAGNPYSGNSFISGLHSEFNPATPYHEGIQQTVTGLTAGEGYLVVFQQTVVKQGNALDTSGSWMVYGDNDLLGISEPSTSDLPFNSLMLVWEERNIGFVAANNSITFKILPWDDDTNQVFSDTDPAGGLRMGIDSIYIIPCGNYQVDFALGNDTMFCQADSLLLDATYSSATYLWQDGSTNATYTANTPGLYWVEVQHACDTVRDSILIEADPSLVIELGQDTLLCLGVSMLLEVPLVNNSTYLWQDNSTGTQYLVEEPGGIFWVESSNDCGTIRDSIEIDFYQEPILNLGDDVILCEGESVLLDATTVNATSYLWSNNSTNATLDVFSENLYQVTVNTFCETLTDDIYVAYQAPIHLDLGNDTTVCPYEELTLDVSYNNATYQWQNASTLSYQHISQPGIYSVTVNVNGCLEEDQIIVSHFPYQSLNLGKDVLLCKETETVLLSSNLLGSYYLWNTGSNESSIEAYPLGNYSLEMVDNYGCILRDTVEVTYNEPKLSLMEDQEICLGETLLISAKGENVKEYYWNTGSTKANISVADPGMITVMVVDSNNCRAWDSLEVSLGGCQVYVPNTFTPNDDGVNDVFMAKGENINIFELAIFNRYGEEVFSTDSIDEGWDGTFKGKASPMGVYSFKVLFQNTVSKDVVSKTGYVSLVR